MNADLMAGISLAGFLLAIILGFTKNINIGIIAVFIAVILGRIGGVADSAIIAGFPTATFVRVLGPMLIFSIAQNNETVAWVCRKALSKIKLPAAAMPLIIFWLSAVISGAGPGSIATPTIMSIVGCSIAYTLKVDPFLFGTLAIYGGVAGALTPFTSVGIVQINQAAAIDVTFSAVGMFVSSCMVHFINALAMYFIFGGYKLKSEESMTELQKERLTQEQFKTLLVLIAFLVVVMVLKWDVGLVGFSGAMVLLLLGADQRKMLSGVPWQTLLMFSGFNMLMTVISAMGGVQLMSDGLSAIMTATTAPAITSILGGVMSMFMSITTVILSLTATVPAVVSALDGGLSHSVMVAAIAVGASAATISPFSLGGSLMQAAYSQTFKPTDSQLRKAWRRQMMMAVSSITLIALLALTGIYHIL